MTALQKLLEALTSAERRALAVSVGASLPYLRHVAKKRRTAGALLALRLEQASARLRKKNPALPLVKRERLSPVCGTCPELKRCRAADSERIHRGLKR